MCLNFCVLFIHTFPSQFSRDVKFRVDSNLAEDVSVSLSISFYFTTEIIPLQINFNYLGSYNLCLQERGSDRHYLDPSERAPEPGESRHRPAAEDEVTSIMFSSNFTAHQFHHISYFSFFHTAWVPPFSSFWQARQRHPADILLVHLRDAALPVLQGDPNQVPHIRGAGQTQGRGQGAYEDPVGQREGERPPVIL